LGGNESPGSFGGWGPYPSGLTEGEKKLLATKVLLEFAELNRFLARQHGSVYRAYREHIVGMRNSDLYPFCPVDVHGPDSSQQQSLFADHAEALGNPNRRDYPVEVSLHMADVDERRKMRATYERRKRENREREQRYQEAGANRMDDVEDVE